MTTQSSNSPTSDREKVRATILTRFTRRGGPTRMTADFTSFPAALQQEIRMAAGIAEPELPIVLTCRDDHSWLLVTSQRIIWKNGLTVASIRGNELEAVVSPVTPNDPKRVVLSPNGVPLAIRIVSGRGGQVTDLPIEPDKTAYGAMHYVLTFILEAGQLKQAVPAAKLRAR